MSASVAPPTHRPAGSAEPLGADPGRAAATNRAPRAAVSRPPNVGRNGVIDGYRGLCAIGVVVGHTLLINQLIFNRAGHDAIWTIFDVLPMFFALSGLMIYRSWVIGALTGKIAKRWPTITGRLWRILPVYYTLVLAVWAMRFVNSPADWADLGLHLSFMQVWSPTYDFWLIGPSWFLADDLHLFLLVTLVAPILCRLALRLPATRWGVSGRMLIMASLPVAMFAFGCGWIWLQVIHDHNHSDYVRYTPLFTMPEFAFGMLTAVVAFTPGVLKPRRWLSLTLTAVGLAALAVLAYYSWRVRWMNIDEFGYPLVSVFCGMLLLGALMMPSDTLFSRVMANRLFKWLAGIGLTILLVQEPLMLILEKWGFVVAWDPTSNWVSAALLTVVAALVGYLFLIGVEKPSLALRDKFRRINALQHGRDHRHRGPIPRMLPDVTLEMLSGTEVSSRSVLADRPLLVAFGDAGTGALAEQQFRIDAGESRALHVAASLDGSALNSERLGAQVVIDRDGRLAEALNVPVALVEVGPDGLITSFQRSRRESLGGWA